jgi:hypothetical protein
VIEWWYTKRKGVSIMEPTIGEIIFYIIAIIGLGGWLLYKVKTADLYIDWIREEGER